MLSDLVTLLHDRYLQTNDDDDLAISIKNNRNVLSLYLSGHSERADACSELAVELHGRFILKKDEADIDESTSLFKLQGCSGTIPRDKRGPLDILGLISWFASLSVENRKTLIKPFLSTAR